MRLRTGHGPNDWSANIPGCHAAVNGHGGTLVQGDPGKVERDRAINRAKAQRKAENRWDGLPRCGFVMRQAGQPCARTAGHSREHKTAEAMEYSRQMRQRVA